MHSLVLDFVPDCLQYEKAGQRHTPNSAFEKVSVDVSIYLVGGV